MTRIAIIGAGMTGLSLARRLSKVAKVVVFEKSRGVSGRMATRRRDGFQFDHGAPFFTAQSEMFRSFLAPFIQKGIVAEWQPKCIRLGTSVKEGEKADVSFPGPLYVCTPHMTSLCKDLAQDLDIKLDTRVTGLAPDTDPSKWKLLTETSNSYSNSSEDGNDNVFDWVISTAPTEQTFDIMLPHLSSTVSGQLSPTWIQSALRPCFVLMLGLSPNIQMNFDCAQVEHPAIEWITISSPSGPPGRSGSTSTVVVQTTAAWTREHYEDAPESVSNYLLNELNSLLPSPLCTSPAAQSLQRWRYARVQEGYSGGDSLLDTERKLAVAGDWCLANNGDGIAFSGVESAFRSASHLAAQLEATL
jgi:renalase